MTLLPRRHFRLIAVVATLLLAFGSTVAPSSSSRAATNQPTATQLKQIKALTSSASKKYKTTVATRASAKKAAAKVKSAKKTYLTASKKAAPHKTAIAKQAKVVATAQAAVDKAQAKLNALTGVTPKASPTPSPTVSSTATPRPSASAAATQSASASPSASPTPVAKKATKKQIAAAKKAAAAAKADLVKKKATLAAANKKAAKVLAASKSAFAALKTANTALASATAAEKTAKAAYTTDLRALNAITSVVPYSGSTCLPGQQIGEETSWNCGVVTHVADGDTIDVKTDDGTIVIRTLGVQTPEIDHLPALAAQCGGYPAQKKLKKILPEGTVVQLRSMHPASYNSRTSEHRYYRSIYIKDEAGNFTVDTAETMYSNGLSIWFPIGEAPGSGVHESQYNLSYRILLEKAIAGKKGLWSKKLCPDPVIKGYNPQRTIDPIIWADVNPAGSDTVYSEHILIKNPGYETLNIAGWKLRDTALNFYTFPKSATIEPGRVIKIYVGKQGDRPSAPEVYYFGSKSTLFHNLEAGHFTGDGVYLSDRQGPKGSGGNMRAWFHYPCLSNTYAITECTKPVVDTAVIPSALGTKTLSEATAELKSLRLKVKVVERATTAEQVGKVLAVSPVAGTRVQASTTVTLTIGIATPTPTATPSPTASPSASAR